MTERMQQPKRRPSFFASQMLEWRASALINGVTDIEMVTLAAQFLGLAVAHTGFAAEHQKSLLETASRISQTVCHAENEKKAGRAWPIQVTNRDEMGKRERMFRVTP